MLRKATVKESVEIPNPFSSKVFSEKYYGLDTNDGALSDEIVNNKSKGRDNPVNDVTVSVFVGEKIEQEIEDKLLQVEFDV